MSFQASTPPASIARKSKTGLAVVALVILFCGSGVVEWFGWPVYAAVNAAVSLVFLGIIWRNRHTITWRRLPAWLVLLLLITALSVASTSWVAPDLTGAVTVWLVNYLLISIIAFGIIATLPWNDFVRALGTALRWVLALSLLWELMGAVTGGGKLFSPAPIAGFSGSPDLLGLLGLVALGVFSTQLYDRTVWRSWGVVWIVLAVATIIAARTEATLVAAIVVAIATGFALWTRASSPLARRGIYIIAAITVSLAGLALGLWTALFGDIALITSWLAPRLPGGIVIALAFLLLCFGIMWRSWFIAVDRPQWDLDEQRPFTGASLIPLMTTAAVMAQGVGEFGSAFEAGWALVVILAVVVKTPQRITFPEVR
jgi:exopolysaccharide production protein ExoQ